MSIYQKQIRLQELCQKGLIDYVILYLHVRIRLLMPHRIYHINYSSAPIPVAARAKAWVCGRSPDEIAGSNPAGAWMSVASVVCQVEVSATS